MTGSVLDGLLSGKAHRFDDFEAWRDVISETFMPLQVDRSADDDFHGALQKQRVGSLRFATMKSGAHRSTQTSRLARQDNSDSYAIGLQIVGRSTFSQDGRTASLGPGDFTVCDCTRPFELDWDRPQVMVTMLFDRSLFEVAVDDVARVTATTVSGRSGLGALAVPTWLRLASGVETYDDHVAAQISRISLEMLQALYLDRIDWRRDGMQQARLSPDARLVQVKAQLRKHLSDPGLSLSQAASGSGISVRRLHGLFEREGQSASRWLLEQRLERAHADLLNVRLNGRSIAEIATRNGFASHSGFSRQFRSRYGDTPRNMRRSGLLSHADLD